MSQKPPPVPRPPTPPRLASGRAATTFSPRLLLPPALLTGGLGLRRRARTIKRSLLGGGGA